MRRQFFIVISVTVAFLSCVLQGQSGIEIRAAASGPVSGWQQMAAPDGGQAVWVSPTNQLTSADIDRAEPSTRPDGRQAVAVIFTDEGAQKMAELSAAQIGKPIAMLLDGKVIWAPVLRGAIGKEALLTGGPNGLTPEQIQRLLTTLKRR